MLLPTQAGRRASRWRLQAALRTPQVYMALVRGEPAAVKLVPLNCQSSPEDELLLESSVQGLSALLESDDQRVAALRRELAVIVRGWQQLEHVCK
jgi:hypothetical protein